MSGWMGFNTAVSGLLASQRSLYISNHNVSNSNTEGYSRQKAVQTTRTGLNIPGVGMLGAGTDITEVVRVRDSYIDQKMWSENSPMGEWNVKQSALSNLERLFNEPSDNSLRQNLDEFFGSFETLSTNPSSYAHRSLVREKAVAMTKHLNETAKKLYNEQKELNFQVSTKIKQVNDYADQIKNLNKQIFELELNKNVANDLRDQRDLIVDKLSKIVNVQVSEENEEFRVGIGGIGLVNHVNVSKITYPPNLIDNPLNPKEKLVQVEWETGNQPVKLEGGELKGLLEARDGDGAGNNYRGIPYYINRLNDYAKTFVDELNKIHSSGYGLDGSTTNIEFFTIDNKSSANFDITTDSVRADNISVSLDIMNNLDNIAAAKTQSGVEDSGNISDIISLRENKNFFNTINAPQGTPDDYIKSLLSSLSVDSQQSIRMKDNQAAIINNVEIRRESESGVSVDEEMSNMVKFQHSYNAAARMITTIDKIFEITINGLGRVGR